MRNALMGLLLMPGLVGFHVLVRNGRVAVAAPTARAEMSLDASVARALSGRFLAPAARSADGTRPTIARRACRVDAPGIGAQVLYVEDAFAGRGRRPFAQRLLAVDPLREGAVRVREFAFIDPESAVGLCDVGGRPAVYRSNTVERRGCDLVLRRRGDRVEGAIEGDRCESRINDAHHLERTLSVTEDSVEVRERGVDASGRVVWGADGAALRFARR